MRWNFDKLNSVISYAPLIYFNHLASLPDFVKLVAISWVRRFSSLVVSVEAAE